MLPYLISIYYLMSLHTSFELLPLLFPNMTPQTDLFGMLQILYSLNDISSKTNNFTYPTGRISDVILLSNPLAFCSHVSPCPKEIFSSHNAWLHIHCPHIPHNLEILRCNKITFKTQTWHSFQQIYILSTFKLPSLIQILYRTCT